MERIKSEHLEMVASLKKEELLAKDKTCLDTLQETRLAKEQCKNDMDKQTKEIYKEIEALQQKANAIEEPIRKNINGLEKKINDTERMVWDYEIAINIVNAQELLKSGIKTSADVIKYAQYYSGRRKIEESEVRQLGHDRGENIIVWAIKGGAWSRKMYYIAIRQNKFLSAIVVEKAQHAGDYTSNKSFGCHKVTDFDKKIEKKSYYREGLSMREWLNKELVKWDGMDDSETIKFWNLYE